jgi:hypothetical protein
MTDPPPSRERPTAAWLAEQEAKQAAYAAKRRAWVEGLQRAATGETEEPPTSSQAAAPSPSTASQLSPSRRQRGVVHDPRQGRLEF